MIFDIRIENINVPSILCQNCIVGSLMNGLVSSKTTSIIHQCYHCALDWGFLVPISRLLIVTNELKWQFYMSRRSAKKLLEKLLLKSEITGERVQITDLSIFLFVNKTEKNCNELKVTKCLDRFWYKINQIGALELWRYMSL